MTQGQAIVKPATEDLLYEIWCADVRQEALIILLRRIRDIDVMMELLDLEDTEPGRAIAAALREYDDAIRPIT